MRSTLETGTRVDRDTSSTLMPFSTRSFWRYWPTEVMRGDRAYLSFASMERHSFPAGVVSESFTHFARSARAESPFPARIETLARAAQASWSEAHPGDSVSSARVKA